VKDSRSITWSKLWLDAGLGLFYPNVCQICGAETARRADGYVGAQCRTRPGGIRFIEPPFCDRCGLPYEGDITTSFQCGNCQEMQLHFRWARAAVVASSLVLEIVHRYKYQRALWFEPCLADLLVRRAAPVLAEGGWDMIVPVPLHPVKQREREFNQAERLALALGRITKIPVNARLVRRVESTKTQTLLTRPQRVENVSGAFLARRGVGLKGQRIVLVDDVLTTGATTSACAKALQAAGAGEVCVWTVARGV